MYTQNISVGVKEFCTKNECFWFIDVINSYQTQKFRIENSFQVWKFKKNKTGNGCVVTCEDGNENKLISQRITFTDCEQKEFKFWCGTGLIYLPSEY